MPKTVLIVEDEQILAKDLQWTLSDLGYGPIAIASSADEALAAASARQPDIVLMDIRIRGHRDGIETAAMLRAQFDVPVVFLTAFADEATLQRAKLTEPYGYLVKPVRGPELRSVLEISLHKHATERQLRAREAELREQKRLLDAVLETMEDAVIVSDVSGVPLVCNAAARYAFGPGFSASAPEAWVRAHGPFQPDGATPLSLAETPLWRSLRGETLRQTEIAMRATEGGESRWHSMNAVPLRGPQGEIIGAVTVGRDVTADRQLREQLRALALRDELTGLFNRRGFLEHVAQQLRIANRTQRGLALLFVDINDMKSINDGFGHGMGDMAIRETGTILRSVLREADIVARLGGDEFAVAALDCDTDVLADALCDRIRSQVDAWNGAAPRAFVLSLSLGAVLYDPAERCSLDALLSRADEQMYVQKRRHGVRRSDGGRTGGARAG